MAVHSDVDRNTCVEDECIGVQLSTGDRCWAHAERHDVNKALAGLRDGGQLDARGVPFTADLLHSVLAGDDAGEGPVTVRHARFDLATFEETAKFDGVTFQGDASFHGATFKRNASFKGAKFTGKTWFGEATFTCDASFSEASFTGTAGFTGATLGKAFFDRTTFEKAAEFDGVTFTGNTSFKWAKFERNALFKGAKFAGEAWFDPATFTGDASFDVATFNSGAWFHEAEVTGNASFTGVTFERARQLGPMVVHERLSLDDATFRERIRIEVCAAALLCKRARFLDGVQLWVRKAEVVLDDADLAAPSVVSGSWPGEPRSALLPQVLSVRGADLAGLTVAGVDLQACHFVRAHHLDQLRAEASNFAQTPRGWGRTKRRIIAEEQEWRAARKPSWGWGPRPHEWLMPNQVAPLYRDLRKGLEDNKDEPGAADFYYGEMEMRRHAKRRKQVRREHTQGLRDSGFGISAATEWAILTLYWLVSGYGLRAWRALASLTAVVLVASLIFVQGGFDEQDQPAFPTALRYSAQATTALLRGSGISGLNEIGEWLQFALRLIGPVLLGLAVLSVRGRVKR